MRINANKFFGFSAFYPIDHEGYKDGMAKRKLESGEE